MPSYMPYPLYRIFFFLAFLLGLSTVTQAQLVQRVGLHVGAATPIGDFKHDRFEDEYPPMARRGLNVQAAYRVEVKPYLAVGATAGFRFNSFDLNAFASPDDVLVLRREASDWKSTYALADLYLQSPSSSLFGFLKGSLGAAYNKSPEVHVDTSFGPIRRTSDSAAALAYGLASGFAIQQGRFLLTVEVGLLGTRPTFEVMDAQGGKSTLKQPMHTVTSMLGLSYTL
ncbi:hypothetical protein [Pontibacter lucknowensis]|nr:hypothetical protein [Pontibacter lucknowensis]